ncbi:MAG: NAD-dependent epimerase/dehydratase family protein [Micrococcales bacterium]|nr:NAD-dependent epimerase/dehydratase family protein [Micrococcales bacterium]
MTSNPSVLFIGGTGTISAACVREAQAIGFDVSVLNRGRSALRPVPEGVGVLHADLDDDAAVDAALAGRRFDVVADFLSYTTPRLQRNVDLLRGRIGQYVFISSASAYQKPPQSLPITESTPLRNDFWQYSRDKIACEDYLVGLWRDEGFPGTIVRPSHTYDQFMIPMMGHWTQLARARAGKPMVIQGDGASLWTLTHASDFAYMFAGLLGNPAALGEAYQITGDEVLTWDAVAHAFATAAGVTDAEIVHVASQTIALVLPDWGPELFGDKTHCAVFDCSKVRALRPGFRQQVPFWRGAREIVAAYDAHPELAVADQELDAALDRLVAIATLAAE